MRFIGDYKIYHDNLLVPINTKYKKNKVFRYNITNNQTHRTWFCLASDFASIDFLKHSIDHAIVHHPFFLLTNISSI